MFNWSAAFIATALLLGLIGYAYGLAEGTYRLYRRGYKDAAYWAAIAGIAAPSLFLVVGFSAR